MRIFCLNFHQQIHPGIAEAFLNYTPLLQFREPGLLFGEVSSTLWMFDNSKVLLEKIQARALELGFTNATVALSDTAAGAQALTRHFDFFLSESGRESDSLASLPTAALKDLEGLRPFANPSQVEDIAEFLFSLGLKSLGDLMKLPRESWNLRWGDLGQSLQRKLACVERSVFSPLVPDQPLIAFQHFEFPIHEQEWLLNSLKPRLQELLLRLEGREQAVDQLSLLLVCEFSGLTQRMVIAPSHKGRDLTLLLNLLRSRMDRLDLDNPVREWELEIEPVSFQPDQLDFWEPQAVVDQDKILRLQSLLQDRQIESGFLRPENQILPEASMSLQKQALAPALPTSEFSVQGAAHRESPVYSQGLNSAPRPTRLVDPPAELSPEEFKGFRLLHRFPIERMEHPWAQALRDYFIALSPRQQCVWIYHDLVSSNYYLQGYFD